MARRLGLAAILTIILAGCSPTVYNREGVAKMAARAPEPGWWEQLHAARTALHPRDSEPDWGEWGSEEAYVRALLEPFVLHEVEPEHRSDALAGRLWVGVPMHVVEMMWGRPHYIENQSTSKDVEWGREKLGEQAWYYLWSPKRIEPHYRSRYHYDRPKPDYPRAVLRFVDGALESWMIREDTAKEFGSGQ